MGQKYVITDEYIEFPAGTPRSDQFSSFFAEAVRAEIESGAFGDMVEKIDKGLFTNTLTCHVRPDADMQFQIYLYQQMVQDDNTPIIYRPKNKPKAADNPELSFVVSVTKVVPFGGERGRLMEGDLQLRINGPITVDFGGTVLILGG